MHIKKAASAVGAGAVFLFPLDLNLTQGCMLVLTKMKGKV